MTTLTKLESLYSAVRKQVNGINPLGIKEFVSRVQGKSRKDLATEALRGVAPAITQYIVGLKLAHPDLTKVQLQVNLDLPSISDGEDEVEYAERLMQYILTTLTADGTGLNVKHLGKNVDMGETKSKDWKRTDRTVGEGLLSMKLTLTQVQFNSLKQVYLPVTSYATVGDDVAQKSVQQLHKGLRDAAKGIESKTTVLPTPVKSAQERAQLRGRIFGAPAAQAADD